MVKYELKKIFCRTGGKVALALLALTLVLSVAWAVNLSFVTDQGESIHGPAAVRQLREMQRAWAGPLTEDRIAQVIQANNDINATPEAQSDDVVLQDKAFHHKQGFGPIRELLNRAYAKEFQDYNYYRADQLTPDMAGDFYSNRIALLESWLPLAAEEDGLTPQQQDFILRQFQTLPTPLDYAYHQGWTQLLELSPTLFMLTALILGFLVSGVFSLEKQTRADAIFFSTNHGRGKAVRAKITAGLLTVTALYFLMAALYTGIVLGYLGGDGMNCPLQISWTYWKSLYNLTFGQTWAIAVLGGYLGTVFLCLLSMLASAKSNSPILASVIPFALIFLPSLLLDTTVTPLAKVIGLLPDRLVQVSRVVTYYDLYPIGDRVAPALPLLLGLYALLALLLLPTLYQVYRRKQVK